MGSDLHYDRAENFQDVEEDVRAEERGEQTGRLKRESQAP